MMDLGSGALPILIPPRFLVTILSKVNNSRLRRPSTPRDHQLAYHVIFTT